MPAMILSVITILLAHTDTSRYQRWYLPPPMPKPILRYLRIAVIHLSGVRKTAQYMLKKQSADPHLMFRLLHITQLLIDGSESEKAAEQSIGIIPQTE